MNRTHVALAAVALAFLLGACQTTTDTQPSAPIDDRTAAAGTASSGTTGATTSGTTAGGVSGSAVGSRPTGTTSASSASNPLRDPANVLSKRTVYFDYDSFIVKDEFRPLVEAHGRYLASNRNARMVVQGNTDERGSREYNIALGQKRADAVKRMMLVLGAQEAQIETVSFGKEKPKNPGHDEAAWAENRRGDMVYSGE
jgi:peptidoglycan-associated lipoprotein